MHNILFRCIYWFLNVYSSVAVILYLFSLLLIAYYNKTFFVDILKWTLLPTSWTLLYKQWTLFLIVDFTTNCHQTNQR